MADVNYSEAKRQQLARQDVYRIHGRTLDFDDDRPGPSTRTSARRLPISPCLCVHDSPDNPCPCHDDMIWWLREDSIVEHGQSDRKGHDGKPLHYFDVLLTSKVGVEAVHPVDVSKLSQLGAALTPSKLLELAHGNDLVIGTSAKPSIPKPGSLLVALVLDMLSDPDWINWAELKKMMEEAEKRKNQPS